MSDFAVEWAEQAYEDVRGILARIAVEHPKNAQAVYRKIVSAATSLCTHPRRGRKVPELVANGVRDCRELLVAPFRLVYRASGKKVTVLAVLDGRRDLEDLLLERALA